MNSEFIATDIGVLAILFIIIREGWEFIRSEIFPRLFGREHQELQAREAAQHQLLVSTTLSTLTANNEELRKLSELLHQLNGVMRMFNNNMNRWGVQIQNIEQRLSE